MNENPRCVYTCLFGNYEDLNEQEIVHDSNMDFFCFTDNPKLKSNTWKIIPVAPLFPYDLARSSRLYKTCPHRVLRDYSASIYIDNSVILRKNPESIFDDLLPAGINLAMFHHSFRETVIDEFNEVIILQLDNINTILEQLNSYSLSRPNVLREKPYWGGFIIRNHLDENVINTMETWFSHILRYSRRDQLSINYVLSDCGYEIHTINLDNHTSEYHYWPQKNNRAQSAYVQNGQLSTISMDLLNRRIENEISDMQTRLFDRKPSGEIIKNQITDSVFSEVLRLLRDANVGDDKYASILLQNALIHIELDEVKRELNQFMNSTSWKITRPLRLIARALKGKAKE
jgi:hypothetical protein